MSQETFKSTILPCKNKAFSIAYRLLGCRYQAEDVVQDTMLKMWEIRANWNEIENIQAYVISVTKNLAMDTLRRRVKEQKVELDPNTEHLDTATPEQIMSAQQSQECFENIIANLAPIQRAAFVLRQQEQMSYQQIADQLNISLESVKTNIFRAREKLKKIYFQTV